MIIYLSSTKSFFDLKDRFKVINLANPPKSEQGGAGRTHTLAVPAKSTHKDR
jgi:hypothetical protein